MATQSPINADTLNFIEALAAGGSKNEKVQGIILNLLADSFMPKQNQQDDLRKMVASRLLDEDVLNPTALKDVLDPNKDITSVLESLGGGTTNTTDTVSQGRKARQDALIANMQATGNENLLPLISQLNPNQFAEYEKYKAPSIAGTLFGEGGLDKIQQLRQEEQAGSALGMFKPVNPFNVRSKIKEEGKQNKLRQLLGV